MTDAKPQKRRSRKIADKLAALRAKQAKQDEK